MANPAKKKIKSEVTLIQGDCLKHLASIPDKSVSLIITSPPYNIGKEYETRQSLEDYIKWIDEIIGKLIPKLKANGSICWQVGNYVDNFELYPLDIYLYNLFKKRGLKLRNRIIWHFNFGLHSTKRFSGRYETLLWFTKSDAYKFNLDAIRIPQKYPGKRHAVSKGDRAGKPSGNPLGKNPSDFWEFSAEQLFKEDIIWKIPNVKANHPEKNDHPCQFPIELVERCVLAFTNEGDTVLDPFVGTGTTLIASKKHNRISIGMDRDNKYIKIAKKRLKDFDDGTLPMRASGKPVHVPKGNERVATIPKEWHITKKH